MKAAQSSGNLFATISASEEEEPEDWAVQSTTDAALSAGDYFSRHSRTTRIHYLNVPKVTSMLPSSCLVPLYLCLPATPSLTPCR